MGALELLVSLLTADLSSRNLKKWLSLVWERLTGKAIEISVEAYGKKIQVSASNQKELELALRQAQNFLESVQDKQNNEYSSGVKLFNELEIKTDYYLSLLKNVIQFLEDAGLTVENRDKRSLYIVSAPENLQIQRQTTVLISGGTPSTDDIVDLVSTSRVLTKKGFQQAGIFLYGEPPDPIVKLRIAEARLGSNFAIIPIPLAEIENALQDNKICEAVLSGYVNRYIQKADFFDDRKGASHLGTKYKY